MSVIECHECPHCGERRARISDSRPGRDPTIKRRRRYHCGQCQHRWTTHEVVVDDLDTGALHMQIMARQFLQIMARQFLRDVEKAAREAFGDENGEMRLGLRQGERVRK